MATYRYVFRASYNDGVTEDVVIYATSVKLAWMKFGSWQADFPWPVEAAEIVDVTNTVQA